MKKTILLSLLFLTCGSLTKVQLLLHNPTNKDSINITKIVLIENGYMINQINNEIIITENKQRSVGGYTYYRWHVLINTIDSKNFILYLPTEFRHGNSTNWTPTELLKEDLANDIINPLIESFKKRGITVNVQRTKNSRRNNNEGYFDR